MLRAIQGTDGCFPELAREGPGEALLLRMYGRNLGTVKRWGALGPLQWLDLADQMIGSLEALHKHGFIHQDVKVDQFVMGEEFDKEALIRLVGEHWREPETPFPVNLILLDFGLSRPCETATRQHQTGMFRGTTGFASRSALEGLSQGPREDMESLLYSLMWLLDYRAPWRDVKASDRADKLE